MNVGFIGAGNMGGAILSAFASSGVSPEDEIFLYDASRDVAESKKEVFPKLHLCDSTPELIGKSSVIVLGIKPQIMDGVLKEIETVSEKDCEERLFISMAAGVSIAHIEAILGADTHVIRIMPNTPALVGEAMIALCKNENATDSDLSEAMRVLKCSGRVEEVDESQIDCVIGVSGSSPAYTYMYLQALTEAAVANGMEKDKARVFASQAVIGAATLAMKSKESLEQLRINVCSPGGTTIEAVNTLMENGFMDKVKAGFQAAVDRSVEMTREKDS